MPEYGPHLRASDADRDQVAALPVLLAVLALAGAVALFTGGPSWLLWAAGGWLLFGHWGTGGRLGFASHGCGRRTHRPRGPASA